MTAAEIHPVVGLMRRKGCDAGYNQETAKNPQLCFPHPFKTRDPLAPAREIRESVDPMNAPCAGPAPLPL